MKVLIHVILLAHHLYVMLAHAITVGIAALLISLPLPVIGLEVEVRGSYITNFYYVNACAVFAQVFRSCEAFDSLWR